MPRKKSELTPFPDSFQITAEMESWFDLHDPPFTIDMHKTFEVWKDACISKHYVYRDWTAAWRNSCRFAQSWKDEKSGMVKAKQADENQKKRVRYRTRDDATGLKQIGKLLETLKGTHTKSTTDTKAP